MTNNVTVINAALDDSPLRGGTIILRGVIHPSSLCNLKIDDYQREVMLGGNQNRLIHSFRTGDVMPDVELGMRGQSFYQPREAGAIKDGVYVLKDPVYVIDGLQRRAAAIASGTEARLGATIHFDTSKEWEEERFFILNSNRIRVSPNIHLRNLRNKYPGVLAFYGLTNSDKQFCACERVSWNQRMRRDDLFGAHMLMKVAGRLHSWVNSGLRTNQVIDLAMALDTLVNTVGISTFKANVRTFVNLVDECWGVGRIQYRESAPQIKGPFLNVLAAIICDHRDFWTGKTGYIMAVNADTKRKLRLFSMNDPTVQNLAGSPGKARYQLYSMLRDHINSGRSTNRLKPRDLLQTPSLDNNDDDSVAAA